MRKQTEELTAAMKASGIDIYIITDCDWHLSEYTSPYFHTLKEFSGFCGGTGRLAVTASGEAALWTDGRFFVAAERELRGSGIKLMKMGEPGVPKLPEWVGSRMPENGVLGFDGRCMPFSEGLGLSEGLHVGQVVSSDLCSLIWKERPALALKNCWVLEEKYAGESAASKLNRVRKAMAAKKARTHVVSSLDDIAWMLNLRGSDIPFNPVFMSFMLITRDEAFLYIDEAHLGDEYVRKYLAALSIVTRPYESIYADLKSVTGTVLIDKKKSNYGLVSSLPGGIKIIDGLNPASAMKCIKNGTEVKNLKKAQHKDSIALTRFMCWFKQNVGKGGLTEWNASQKLHELRAGQEGFLDESFDTISAYAENAAMVHYETTEEGSAPILPKGLYLVDSGGQYLEGTTDVTRTFGCGPLTDEEKKAFTLVAAANMRLMDAVFPEGISGTVLDGIARDLLWKNGYDYNHGTGHGVGFCLNVHEAPVGVRCRASSPEAAWPMCGGMYFSDEPGIYVEGKFGIRTENLLLCVHSHTNSFGRFMKFEAMNFCPIDKDCLDAVYLEPHDLELINGYNKRVYEKLNAELPDEEKAWLKEACSPLLKK